MFKRILLAVDLSVDSQRAVKLAMQLARSFDAELIFCHAFQPLLGMAMAPRARQLRRDVRAAGLKAARRRLGALDKAARRAGVKTSSLLVDGSPAAAVARTAKRRSADLVVVGTRGRMGMSRLLAGSVAEAIVRRTDCPVLVVRNAPRR